VLANIAEFNPWNVFKKLSHKDKLGYITTQSLYDFLSSNHVQASQLELHQFFQSLNPQIATKISY